MIKHGHSLKGWRSPEYYSWSGAIARCNNRNHPKYYMYGAVGIKVCDAWRESFLSFLNDMGPRPKGHSIERIDSKGDYEPGNCKWATVIEQNRNTTRNRAITVNGKTMLIVDWAKELGCNPALISTRIIQLGWSEEKSVTTPPDRRFASR